MRGPTSSPIQPSGTSTPSCSRRSVSASKLRPSTRSTGSTSRQRELSAFSSALRASSTPSSSTSESPVEMPCARKNEKHIAPPIRSTSASSRKRSMSAILSLTLAPPSTTTSGRSGASMIERSVTTSRSSSRPATAGRRNSVDAHGRGVRPVGRAEGVVHVGVGERRQLLRELGVVLGLAALPARVLEHQHVAGLEPLDAAPHLRPDDVGRLMDARVDQLAETLGDRLQRRLGVAALRPAEMRAEHEPRALLEQQLDRRQRGPDARVVRDAPVLERDVEVDAREHRLAGPDLEVADGALSQICGGRLRQPATPPARAAPGRRRGSSSPTRCRTRRSPSRAARRSPS